MIAALGEAATLLAFWIIVSIITACVWARWRDGCKGHARSKEQR